MSYVAIELEGHTDAEQIRNIFFAAARAVLEVDELHFEMATIPNGQRWEAEGAVYTCKCTGDPPQDPVPQRDSPAGTTHLELNVAGYTLRLTYSYLLGTEDARVPLEQRNHYFGMRNSAIVMDWPGLTLFDRIWQSVSKAVDRISNLHDWTATVSRTCKNAEAVMEAGDEAGAESLLSRCVPTFEKPKGVVPAYWRERLYMLLQQIRPLSLEEEGLRVNHAPHCTSLWLSLAEAGGGGGWLAWEAKYIAAMQRPWDPEAHADMPKGGDALGLLAMGHPRWPWVRPEVIPEARWLPIDHNKLHEILQIIGFSKSDAHDFVPNTQEPLLYSIYNAASNTLDADAPYVLTNDYWWAGVIALQPVSRNPKPPMLWQKIALTIKTTTGPSQWIWFQAGEPGRGLCLHNSRGPCEIALAGPQDWLGTVQKAIKKLG